MSLLQRFAFMAPFRFFAQVLFTNMTFICLVCELCCLSSCLLYGLSYCLCILVVASGAAHPTTIRISETGHGRMDCSQTSRQIIAYAFASKVVLGICMRGNAEWMSTHLIKTRYWVCLVGRAI